MPSTGEIWRGDAKTVVMHAITQLSFLVVEPAHVHKGKRRDAVFLCCRAHQHCRHLVLDVIVVAGKDMTIGVMTNKGVSTIERE